MLYWLSICLLCTQVFGVSVPNSLPGTHQDVRTVNLEESELQSPNRFLHENVLLRLGEGYPTGVNVAVPRQGNAKKSDLRTTRIKRTPTGFTARGFHDQAFDRDFGHFSPVKKSISMDKRRPEADSAGFYGDTFSQGFGTFETMKRRANQIDRELGFEASKRRPSGMSSQGFHDDTFNQGLFNGFDTMKRHYPYNNWADAKKRRPEMDKMGFHGDVFSQGFGGFDTM